MEKPCDGPSGPTLYLVINALGIRWLDPGGNTAPVWRFAGRDGEPGPGAPTGGSAAPPGCGAGVARHDRNAGCDIAPRGRSAVRDLLRGGNSFPRIDTGFRFGFDANRQPRARQDAKTDASAFVFMTVLPLRRAGPEASNRMRLGPARLDFPDRAGRRPSDAGLRGYSTGGGRGDLPRRVPDRTWDRRLS